MVSRLGAGRIGASATTRGLTSQAAKLGLKNKKPTNESLAQLKRIKHSGDLIDLLNELLAGNADLPPEERIQTVAEIDAELRSRGIDTTGFKYGPASGTGARFIYGTPDRSPTGATMVYPRQ